MKLLSKIASLGRYRERLPGTIPLLLAASSGLLLYFSSPGSGGHAALAWLALVPLLLALNGTSHFKASILGLTCGMVYYLPLLRWIINVLAVHGGVVLPVASLALFLLALYMSIYLLIFALITNSLSKLKKAYLVWLIPILWIGLEQARALLFTGFPWQDIAYSQYQTPVLIQAAELGGHHLLGFIIILSNYLGFLLVDFVSKRSGKNQGFAGKGEVKPKTFSTSLPAVSMSIALLIIIALPSYGFYRYKAIENRLNESEGSQISIIQGNIAQDDKWHPSMQEQTIKRYLELSQESLPTAPQTLIWPETALPFFPLEHYLFDKLIEFVQKNSVCLLTGAPHRLYDPTGKLKYYNSALMLSPPEKKQHKDRPGEEAQEPKVRLDFYHKQHLVPFGEYVPFRRLLPFFAPIVETMGDFSPGAGSTILSCGEKSYGTLICYEAIFPYLARGLNKAGAEILVNITNDAWFGPTNAPHQHLSMSVFRAVENRMPLARAANTGISAFITPNGRIEQESPIFAATWLASKQGATGVSSSTIFVRGGFLFGYACLLGLLGIIIWLLWKNKSKAITRNSQQRQ